MSDRTVFEFQLVTCTKSLLNSQPQFPYLYNAEKMLTLLGGGGSKRY